MFKKIIKLSLTAFLCSVYVLQADDTIVEFFEATGRVVIRSSESITGTKNSKPTVSLTIKSNEQLPLADALLSQYAKGIRAVEFDTFLFLVNSDAPEHLVNTLSTLSALEEVNLAGVSINAEEWNGIKDIPVISKLSFSDTFPWKYSEQLKEGKWQKITMPLPHNNIVVMTSEMTPVFRDFLRHALPKLKCIQKQSEHMLPELAASKPLGMEVIGWDGILSTTYVPAEEIYLRRSGLVTELLPLRRTIRGELIFDGGFTSHEYPYNYTPLKGESFNWLQAFFQSEFPDVTVTMTANEITLDKRPAPVALAAEDVGN